MQPFCTLQVRAVTARFGQCRRADLSRSFCARCGALSSPHADGRTCRPPAPRRAVRGNAGPGACRCRDRAGRGDVRGGRGPDIGRRHRGLVVHRGQRRGRGGAVRSHRAARRWCRGRRAGGAGPTRARGNRNCGRADACISPDQAGLRRRAAGPSRDRIGRHCRAGPPDSRDACAPDAAMRAKLALLPGQTVSLGLFCAFLVVPPRALFLARYGARALPYAYLAVAATGVVVSAALRRPQPRLALGALAVSVVGTFLVLVAAAWVVLTVSDGIWVTFPLLVLFPVSIPIGFVLVGSQAGRLLDLREMKAYLPRVFAGFSVGFVSWGLLAAWLVHGVGGPVRLLGFATVCAPPRPLRVVLPARPPTPPPRPRPPH